MGVSVAILGKQHRALGAHKRFFARVLSHVHVEQLRRRIRLAAHGARVSAYLVLSDFVVLERRIVLERVVAHRALDWFLARVLPAVHHQLTLGCKLVLTRPARVWVPLGVDTNRMNVELLLV